MKHITTVAEANIRRGDFTGCGECQASCQSACKNVLHGGKPKLQKYR